MLVYIFSRLVAVLENYGCISGRLECESIPVQFMAYLVQLDIEPLFEIIVKIDNKAKIFSQNLV